MQRIVCPSIVDLRQNIFVPVTASRVGVGLVDQLLDRAFAVADDVRRHAFGNRDQPIIDDQSAKIRIADQLFFDDDPARIFLGFFKGDLRVFQIR